MSKITKLKALFVIGFENNQHVIYKNGEVVFKDDRIIFCGKNYKGPFDEEFDAGKSIISPGFIDLDSDIDTDHALIDVAVPKSIQDRFKMGDKFRTKDPYTLEDFYVRQKFSMAQLIKNGITTAMPIEGELFHGFSQTYEEFEVMAHVALELNYRLYVGPSFKSQKAVGFDVEPDREKKSFEDALRFFDNFDGKGEGLIKGFMNPCQISCTRFEILAQAMEFAKSKDIPMRLHACEGLHEWDLLKTMGLESTITYFEKQGMLASNLLIPHCIVAKDSELELLRNYDVSIIHTPIAEINVGTALVSFSKYQDYGINITMGTDAQPNDMIQNMRYALDLDRMFYKQQIFQKYPEQGEAFNRPIENHFNRISAKDVFNAATINAAKALRRNDIGKLAENMKADIIIIDLDDINVGPYQDPIRTILKSCVGNNVSSTIIDGKWLMKDRKLINIDEKLLLNQMQKVYDKFINLYEVYDASNRPIETFFPSEFKIIE